MRLDLEDQVKKFYQHINEFCGIFGVKEDKPERQIESVWDVIDCLEDKLERDVFRLYRWEGKSYREIARELGVNYMKVKRVLNKADARVRKVYGK